MEDAIYDPVREYETDEAEECTARVVFWPTEGGYIESNAFTLKGPSNRRPGLKAMRSRGLVGLLSSAAQALSCVWQGMKAQVRHDHGLRRS